MNIAAFGVALLSLLVAVGVQSLGFGAHLPFAADANGFQRLANSRAGTEGTWRAVHILAAGCRCSRGVAEHLAARGRLSGLNESVLVVGRDDVLEQVIRGAGMHSATITAEEASQRYHLAGAPWMVLVGPGGEVRYAGGYSRDRSGRGGYEDVAIWRALEAGKPYDALPAYGCAVGQQAKGTLDPLGLAKSREWGGTK